jgi:hypothetical protein
MKLAQKGERLMPAISRGDLIQAFVSLAVAWLLMGATLFLSAGAILWPRALLFLAVFLFFTVIAMVWLWRVNPGIYIARSRLTGQGTKSRDRVLLSVLLANFLATLVVAALDDGRFHWAPAPPWVGPLWALPAAALVVVVLAIRTNLEDGTLHRELPGGTAVRPCVALSAGSRRHAARHPCRIAAQAHEREESRHGRGLKTASSDGIQRLLIWCQDICKASGPVSSFSLARPLHGMDPEGS